jgi:hypothetical protein
VKAFEHALRAQGCDVCGSRKTILRGRGEVPDVSLVHAGGLQQAGGPVRR